jgi:hypothetical protein
VVPRATRGAQLYAELSRSRKGVCRHRAYAFTVTALGLGIPTRMLRNEAHAWVEVYDGVRFHRIDLGGAAGRMDMDPGAAEHVYRPPRDAFDWPSGSEPGQDMLSQTSASGDDAEPSRAGPVASGVAPSAPAPPASSLPSPGAPRPQLPGDDRPRASVELEVAQSSSPRGAAVRVTGKVEAAGEPCPFSRVDVSLLDGAGLETWLGALPTDQHGKLEGRLIVPVDIDVGDYRVVARTPGTGRCGASR